MDLPLSENAGEGVPPGISPDRHPPRRPIRLSGLTRPSYCCPAMIAWTSSRLMDFICSQGPSEASAAPFWMEV